MSLPLFAALLLTTVLAAAAAWDLRTRRIPNALTVPAFAAALALAALRGWPALGAALAGAALALAVGAGVHGRRGRRALAAGDPPRPRVHPHHARHRRPGGVRDHRRAPGLAG